MSEKLRINFLDDFEIEALAKKIVENIHYTVIPEEIENVTPIEMALYIGTVFTLGAIMINGLINSLAKNNSPLRSELLNQYQKAFDEIKSKHLN